jgi:hypothetical protein
MSRSETLMNLQGQEANNVYLFIFYHVYLTRDLDSCLLLFEGMNSEGNLQALNCQATRQSGGLGFEEEM